MEQKDLDALIAKIGQEAAEKIKSETEGLKKQLEELKAEGKDKSDEAKKMEQKLADLTESVKTIAENQEKADAPVQMHDGGFYGVLVKALEGKKADLELAKTNKNHSVQLEVKASNSVLTVGYTSSSPNAYLPVPSFVPGYYTSPEVAVTIMDVIDMGTSSSPTVTWVNEQPIEGDAGWTAEGELKAQVAWKYENETSTAVKVTAFVKVTTEALNDIPWLASRINSRLIELVRRKIQDGIINGDGTSNSLDGIINQVSTYVTDSFDDSVDNPGTAEALMAMAGQIEELEYDTTNIVAVMNGVDIRKMKWRKDDEGRYMIPNFLTPNGTFVDNMRVIKNNKVPKGFAIVGDLKKFTVLMVENLMLDIGLDADDFTKNRRTIICEARLLSMISENDLGAIVYAELAAVQAEIDAAI